MASSEVNVIVAGARTPIGRFLGGLKDLTAAELGGIAIDAALKKAGVRPDQVDYLLMGQVILAGAGQNPARTAGLAAGLPATVPSVTVNKVCLSGINSVALASQMVSSGEAVIVVAGGMESMSNSPHLLPRSRTGVKFGDTTLVDSLAYDALYDQSTQQAMGGLAEDYNKAHPLSREEQDAFAARSHQRAATAWKTGIFDDEVVPVRVLGRNGTSSRVTTDEGVRPDTTTESLAKLRPAFSSDGTVTAGSSSQLSDGAAAVVVMAKSTAEDLGLSWIAEIVAHGQVAGPDSTLQMQPANAARRACEKAGVSPVDLDLAEFNEAFAAVGIESSRALGLSEDIVNVNGGAIALGHPVGMSGTRVVLHLGLELRRRGGGIGVAALCGGGGQGDALVLRVPTQ